MSTQTKREFTLLIEMRDGSRLNFFKVIAESAQDAIKAFKKTNEIRIYRIVKVMNQF